MDLPRFVGIFAEEWKQKMIDGIAETFPKFDRNLHLFYMFEFYYDERVGVERVDVEIAKKLFYMNKILNDLENRGSIASIKFAVIRIWGDYHCHWSHIGQYGDEIYGEHNFTIYDNKLEFKDFGCHTGDKAFWFSYPHNHKLTNVKMVYVQHNITFLQLTTILEFQTNPTNYAENAIITDVERVFADNHIVKSITCY